MRKRGVVGLLLLPGIIIIWMFGWLLYTSPHRSKPVQSTQMYAKCLRKLKKGSQFIPLAA